MQSVQFSQYGSPFSLTRSPCKRATPQTSHPPLFTKVLNFISKLHILHSFLLNLKVIHERLHYSFIESVFPLDSMSVRAPGGDCVLLCLTLLNRLLDVIETREIGFRILFNLGSTLLI